MTLNFEALISAFLIASTSLADNSLVELKPEDVEEGSCIIPYPTAVTPSGSFLLVNCCYYIQFK